MSSPARRIGTFALTLDTELIWGSFDHTTPAAFERRYPAVRETIGSILRLLDDYSIPATWAVVGHLFLSSCERDAAGIAHPSIVRPPQRHRPGDWYADDPCTDVDTDSLWYGPDIVDRIQAAKVTHEIGCHSFGHPLFGDPEMTRAAADSDISACLELAERRGIRLRSFVFPRNSEGHHDVLRAHGFTAFRGADPSAMGWAPGPIRRAAHFGLNIIGSPPPVSDPTETLPGLWNIPGSMLFLHRSGVRRAVGRQARLRRMRAGLRKVQQSGGIFHLWTHPFNVASDPIELLPILEQLLADVARSRDRGQLEVATMAMIAESAGP